MDNSLILYTTDDGKSQLVLRELGDQVWLTQLEMAELYQTSKQNISKHVKAVLSDRELAEVAVVNSKLTTADDGKEYLTKLYALPMIIAVGYRVRSTRGTQFRQWATKRASRRTRHRRAVKLDTAEEGKITNGALLPQISGRIQCQASGTGVAKS